MATNQVTVEEIPEDSIDSLTKSIDGVHINDDIDDIVEPPKELSEGMKKIDFSSMSQEQINNLINSLSQSDFINPNTNRFCKASEEDIRKEQLKRKLKAMKEQRSTKKCRHARKKKRQEHLEKIIRKRQAETPQNTESSNQVEQVPSEA